ncbi:MAG: aslB [Xanthobacteraceae bacterium]|nr:aslB [Xanthobacteraceae bacterium]
MGVELKPLGVVCNIQCHYCYENPLRDAGNKPAAYDMDAMKAAVLREGQPFSLFGGEALLMPKPDLEALWSWGLEQFGRNGVQTNGTLIDDAHIALFKRYKVDVGISVDGPAELNDARWSANLAKTRDATARTQAAIETLCREGIPPGLIVTLHRGNASADKLPALCDWFRHLDRVGVRHVRLHVLEIDSPKVRELYALSAEACIEAMLRLLALEQTGLPALRFDVFDDMRALLMGRDEKSTCTWNACDPLATQAVRGIEGNGQATNCSRTNKEGIDFVKSDAGGFERYLALYRTSQEHGGCRDCRFFLMCKGQCPGTAIDGDWRNRSESCEVWKGLFEHLEQGLLRAGELPLSRRPERRAVEEIFVERWEKGRNTDIAGALKRLASAAPASPTEPEKPGPMPDFTRVSWIDDRARDVWQPRLARIATAWAEVEWLSVPAGLRACAITTLAPGLFVQRARAWAGLGLGALPLSVHGRGPLAAGAAGGIAVPRRIDSFRVAVAAPKDLAALTHALDRHDDAAISDLLGVPACCAAHRRRLSADAALDPTWHIVTGGPPRAHAPDALHDNDARIVDVHGPWQTNILWRWLGVRATPHLPCGLDCEASRDIADRLCELGGQAGYDQEMDWMREILSWPAEWSALHGIAIVSTPILKLATRTDATDRKFTVRRHGDDYPAEGATGLCFPYRRQAAHRFTASRAFGIGTEHALSARGALP